MAPIAGTRGMGPVGGSSPIRGAILLVESFGAGTAPPDRKPEGCPVVTMPVGPGPALAAFSKPASDFSERD